MKSSIIVANWKSNKILEEVEEWVEKFSENTLAADKKVIICPSFTLLSDLKNLITKKNLKLEIGAQDISAFDKGPYTGEVNAAQVKDFAKYILIGHSERRKNFKETNQTLEQKVTLAKNYGLDPIFCIQGDDTYIPSGVQIVAYEPFFAIGTGNPDTAENAEKIGSMIKQKGFGNFLYGGSVNLENIKTFTSMPSIDGVLIGKASLDPLEFFKIIESS
jgi:triosephosphate isomerase